MSKSVLESQFKNLWNSQFPELPCKQEVSDIIPQRKFKFDFAWIDSKVAVEINGQIWQPGGHSSGNGLIRDYEKLNLAQAEGWIVFQLSKEMITTKWITIIVNTIKSRKICQSNKSKK